MTPNNVKANLYREVQYIGNEHPELKNKLFTFIKASITREIDAHGNLGKFYYQADISEHGNRVLYTVNLKDIKLPEE